MKQRETPKKPSDNSTSIKTGSRKLQIVPELNTSHKYSHSRRNSSDGYTYFQTFPNNNNNMVNNSNSTNNNNNQQQAQYRKQSSIQSKAMREMDKKQQKYLIDNDDNCSVEYDNNSVCASIENGMLEGLLTDLKNQIKLKNQGIQLATFYIKKLQQNVELLQKQNDELKKQLQQVYQQLKIAQQQISKYTKTQNSNMKSSHFNLQSKKSITKTYITQKNITFPQQYNNNQLALISSQMLKQFISNYEGLINQLSHFVVKQLQSQNQSSVYQRMQTHCLQIQQLMLSKNEDQYSKTTYQTTNTGINYQNPFEHSSNKKNYINNNINSLYSSYNSNNEYQQTIQLYKQHIDRLTVQLSQAVSYINQLTKQLSSSASMLSSSCVSNNKNSSSNNGRISPICSYPQLSNHNNMEHNRNQSTTSSLYSYHYNQPSTLLPKQLISIVVQECSTLVSQKYKQLKNQNGQLVNIIQGMISWIQKNSRDGGQQFRNVFSSQL